MDEIEAVSFRKLFEVGAAVGRIATECDVGFQAEDGVVQVAVAAAIGESANAGPDART